jgi:hypothetical protein
VHMRISENLLIGGDQAQSVDPGRGHQKTIHGIGMKRFGQRICLLCVLEFFSATSALVCALK